VPNPIVDGGRRFTGKCFLFLLETIHLYIFSSNIGSRGITDVHSSFVLVKILVSLNVKYFTIFMAFKSQFLSSVYILCIRL